MNESQERNPSSPAVFSDRARRAQNLRVVARSKVRDHWVAERAKELEATGVQIAEAWRLAFLEADR